MTDSTAVDGQVAVLRLGHLLRRLRLLVGVARHVARAVATPCG